MPTKRELKNTQINWELANCMDYLHAWLREEAGPPLRKELTRPKKHLLRYANKASRVVYIFTP